MNNYTWPEGIDNYFSGNHRTRMLQLHKGTMAQIYTVEQFIKEFERRSHE